MRLAHFLWIFLLVGAQLPARAAAFVPGPYGAADGALFLTSGGDYVEPYFATKSLLVAQDVGLDVRASALKWVEWVMPRQLKNGRFERYCRDSAGAWRACGSADADDSMLALW